MRIVSVATLAITMALTTLVPQSQAQQPEFPVEPTGNSQTYPQSGPYFELQVRSEPNELRRSSVVLVDCPSIEDEDVPGCRHAQAHAHSASSNPMSNIWSNVVRWFAGTNSHPMTAQGVVIEHHVASPPHPHSGAEGFLPAQPVHVPVELPAGLSMVPGQNAPHHQRLYSLPQAYPAPPQAITRRCPTAAPISEQPTDIPATDPYLDADANRLYSLGEYYLQAGHLKTAETLFHMAHSKDPTSTVGVRAMQRFDEVRNQIQQGRPENLAPPVYPTTYRVVPAPGRCGVPSSSDNVGVGVEGQTQTCTSPVGGLLRWAASQFPTNDEHVCGSAPTVCPEDANKPEGEKACPRRCPFACPATQCPVSCPSRSSAVDTEDKCATEGKCPFACGKIVTKTCPTRCLVPCIFNPFGVCLELYLRNCQIKRCPLEGCCKGVPAKCCEKRAKCCTTACNGETKCVNDKSRECKKVCQCATNCKCGTNCKCEQIIQGETTCCKERCKVVSCSKRSSCPCIQKTAGGCCQGTPSKTSTVVCPIQAAGCDPDVLQAISKLIEASRNNNGNTVVIIITGSAKGNTTSTPISVPTEDKPQPKKCTCPRRKQTKPKPEFQTQNDDFPLDFDIDLDFGTGILDKPTTEDEDDWVDELIDSFRDGLGGVDVDFDTTTSRGIRLQSNVNLGGLRFHMIYDDGQYNIVCPMFR
ncbi:MAG: hypothetical protein ACFCD0_07120 [Gemmataceae bacterium]